MILHTLAHLVLETCRLSQQAQESWGRHMRVPIRRTPRLEKGASSEKCALGPDAWQDGLSQV